MLYFFEGFETVGAELGLANQATTRPRINLRWDDAASGGTPSLDSYFLINDPFSEGFALNFGTSSFSSGNSLWLDIEESRRDPPGALVREWVIGWRMHVPNNDVESFDVMLVNGLFGGTNHTTVLFFSIADSTDITVTRANPGQFQIAAAEDVLIPGAWHYIEAKFKIAEAPDVTRVNQFTAPVDTGNYTLTLEVPSVGGGEFTTASIAYNATAATIAAAIDTAAPAEVTTNFVNVSSSGTAGLSDGYIEITADDNSPVTVVIEDVDLVGFEMETGEELLGEVIMSVGGFVEVRVDGSEVISVHNVDTNNALSTAFYELEFGNQSGNTGNPDNFVGLDDIYVIDASEAPHQDFLGSVRVRSLPPDGDVFSQWTNTSGTGPNYAHVDENGANPADYVETDVDAERDRYTITNVVENDEILAVKVEAEVINIEGGPPSIFLEVASGASVETEENTITSNTAYVLLDMYVQDDPAGGAWTESGINSLQAGYQFKNNVS